MKDSEFERFFGDYAKNVDNAERQGFWRLSDDIVMALIMRYLAPGLREDSVLLDAGGGTGRWVVKLSGHMSCRFVVFDKSKDMLARARANTSQLMPSERVELVLGDMEDMGDIQSASIDAITSIYNPISFVEHTQSAFSELRRVLKPGGRMLLMGQGFSNAISSKINNYLAGAEELEALERSSTVCWAEHVPPLRVFTQDSLMEGLRQAGFNLVGAYGVPVFLQPTSEDFDPENQLMGDRSKRLAEDDWFYDEVLRLEMKYNGLPEMVERGMNIVAVVE